MATATLASHNSEERKSGKNPDFLSRTDLSEMLDAADFSREAEAYVIRKAGREKGSRNYRRRHLVAALKGIWRASSSPYGTGEIQFYASVEGYAIEAGVSERALRYNLRELERIGVIEQIYAANTIRRPATYRLNVSALRRRRTYQDVKSSRKPATPFRPHSAEARAQHRSSPPAQEAASSMPPTTAAPVAVAPTTQIFNRGVRETRAALMNLVTDLQKPRKNPQGNVLSQCELQLAHSAIEPKLSASPDPWAEILQYLRKRVNPHSFETWLKPTKFRAADRKTMFVTLPTREFAFLGEKFATPIEEAIADGLLGYERVVFEWTEPTMQEQPALKFEDAVREACRQLAIPLVSANEITGWKVKPEGEG